MLLAAARHGALGLVRRNRFSSMHDILCFAAISLRHGDPQACMPAARVVDERIATKRAADKINGTFMQIPIISSFHQTQAGASGRGSATET